MIFLQILKIVGIVLLILLGLLLFVIGLILWVPVYYKANGSYREQIDLEIKANWLFHFIDFYYIISDDKAHYNFRVAWSTWWTSEEDIKVKTPFKEEDFFDDDMDEELEEEIEIEKDSQYGDDNKKDRNDNASSSSFEDKVEEKLEEKREQLHEKKEQLHNKKEAIHEKAESAKEKRHTFSSLIKKVKEIRKLLKRKEFKYTYEKIKKDIHKLLKLIMPKVFRLNAEFSTGSPDTTAYIYGLLCMLPYGYKNKWSLDPDFEGEKAYLNGDFSLRGHFSFYHALNMFLSYMLDKKCHKCFYYIKKIMEG